MGFSFRKKNRIRSPQPIVISRLAEVPPGQRSQTRILDVPAGNGVLMIPLAAAGFDVVGYDLFPEYAHQTLNIFREVGLMEGVRRSCKGFLTDKVCHKLFGGASPSLPSSLNIIPGDMEHQLPFADSSFDVVTCVEGIEHVDAQYKLIGELRRVLKPGGRLFLTTPNMMCVRSRVAHSLTGQRTFGTFIDEFTEIQDKSENGKRIYHGHVFLLDYFQLRYYLHNNSFKIERLLPFPASMDSLILSLPFIPCMALAAPWGPLRALKKLRRLKKKGLVPSSTRAPYAEILRHAFSRQALFGSVIAIEASAQ